MNVRVPIWGLGNIAIEILSLHYGSEDIVEPNMENKT